jgi:hypothetical protein
MRGWLGNNGVSMRTRSKFPKKGFAILVLLAFAVGGCGGPELTDEDLGKIHYSIPKLKGDEGVIPFPPRAAMEPSSQPTGATQPADQPSGAEPMGTALPASQATPGTSSAVQGTA